MTSFGPRNIFTLINMKLYLNDFISSPDRLISDSLLKQEADTEENKARYFLHNFVQSLLPTFGIAAK
jgi:hypothetical protein